ncbi:hypothetical protein HG1285_11128, partial [Hydrogenivirga sp. 128-5-R1-1]
ASQLYPNYSNVQKVVESIYQNVLGKSPTDDPNGIAYWVGEINAGHTTVGKVAADIIYVAKTKYPNDPATKTLGNRADVAVYVADNIPNSDINGDGKTDKVDFDLFKNFIANVTNDPATVNTAKSLADGYKPVNVSLTTGTDTITGSKAADTFNAVVSSLSSEATLNSGDKVDGSDGIDTLNISMKGSFAGIGSGYIKNIEKINLKNETIIDRTFDAKNISGVETYNLTGSDAGNSISLSNLGEAGIEINFKNMSRDATITFDSNTNLSGSSDAMVIGVNNLGKPDPTPNNGIDNATYTKITMSKIENITVNTSGSKSYVDMSGFQSATSITVKGDQDLAIKNIPSTLTAFDASNNSGAITADFTNATAGKLGTIKTAGKDDVVSIKTSTINIAPTIDLGNGNDKLKLDVAAAATIQPVMNGVDTLELTNLGGNLTFSAAKTTGLMQ